MDELDEFFGQRDKRLAEQEARRERERKAAEERVRQEQEAVALLRAKCESEYAALREEVKNLASKYADKGFTVGIGDRVQLGGVQASFTPPNKLDGLLQNPGASFNPVGLGAVPSNLATLPVTQIAVDGQIKWRINHPSRFDELDAWDTPGLARRIIKQLVEAADALKSH